MTLSTAWKRSSSSGSLAARFVLPRLTMKVEELPKWTHVFPVLLGVGIGITGMYAFPLVGLRNTLGPILGLPTGFILGFVLLAIVARFMD